MSEGQLFKGGEVNFVHEIVIASQLDLRGDGLFCHVQHSAVIRLCARSLVAN